MLQFIKDSLFQVPISQVKLTTILFRLLTWQINRLTTISLKLITMHTMILKAEPLSTIRMFT